MLGAGSLRVRREKERLPGFKSMQLYEKIVNSCVLLKWVSAIRGILRDYVQKSLVIRI